MNWSALFFLNSAALGVGLAMDAFSVSCANGLAEPRMRRGRMCLIAGTYAFFQFAMPVIGWICVRTVAERFAALQKFIPWIALVLLLYIGGKMLLEGIRARKTERKDTIGVIAGAEKTDGGADASEKRLAFGTLLLQGVATSIDALSVGFTIADYSAAMALAASLIIAAVTFAICIGGLLIGKKFGTRLESRASILGGAILVAIGLEIWLKGIL